MVVVPGLDQARDPKPSHDDWKEGALAMLIDFLGLSLPFMGETGRASGQGEGV
jgi:hypothetical protein